MVKAGRKRKKPETILKEIEAIISEEESEESGEETRKCHRADLAQFGLYGPDFLPKLLEQGVPVPKGFELFPYGLSAYRHTTLGESLTEALALVELAHPDLFPPLSEALVNLMKIMDVFDETICKNFNKYRRSSRVPQRALFLKSDVRSYKIINENSLMYLELSEIRERPTARSAGFHILSPSMKLVLLDENLLPPSDRAPFPQQKYLRRQPKRRFPKKTLTPSGMPVPRKHPWSRPMITEDQMKLLTWKATQSKWFG